MKFIDINQSSRDSKGAGAAPWHGSLWAPVFVLLSCLGSIRDDKQLAFIIHG